MQLLPITSENFTELKMLQRLPHRWLTDIEWSSDIQTLAIAAASGLYLYDVRAMHQRPRYLDGHTDPVRALAITPDSQTLISGGDDATVRLWDIPTGNEKAILTHPQNQASVADIAVNPQQTLLGIGRGQRVEVWELATHRLLTTFDDPKGDMTCVAFSPDGKFLASGGWDTQVYVWELSSGKLAYTLSGAEQRINSVIFSLDGKEIISANRDHTIRVYSLDTGETIHVLRDHQSPVDCLTFSPDGKFLVSGGRDDIVRFWDAQTYTPIGLLAEGHRKPILRITFNPQGIAFATASGDNNLRLWGVPVQNQV